MSYILLYINVLLTSVAIFRVAKQGKSQKDIVLFLQRINCCIHNYLLLLFYELDCQILYFN